MKPSTANRVGYIVQLLLNAWNSLARRIGMVKCSMLIAPYILFNESTCQFYPLNSRSDGLAPLSQGKSLKGIVGGCLDEKGCDAEAFKRSDELDHALRCITKFFFDSLHELSPNRQLFEVKDSVWWDYLDRFLDVGSNIAPIFQSLPDDVKQIIGISNDGVAPQIEVINVEDSENSGKVERPTKKRKLLRDAFSPTIGRVKIEDEVDLVEEEPAPPRRGQDVGNTIPVQEEDSSNVSKEMQQLMQPYCRIYDTHFRNLVDLDMELNGEHLDEAVQLILTDPPYNTRRESNARNSDHDSLLLADIAECVDLFGRVLRPGGHGLVFCSMLQFNSWFRLLLQHKETNTAPVESQEQSIYPPNERNTFRVDKVPLFFVPSSGQYASNPAFKKVSHTSIVQIAIHFWKPSEKGEDDLDRANYSNHGYIASKHPSWTNCLDNIPRLEANEKVMVQMEDAREVMLRPEQKNVDLLKELILQYTSKGDIVFDFFGGTFATAKACLSLPEHRVFVGCDMDSKCVSSALPSVLDTFSRAVIHKQNDVSVPDSGLITLERYREIRKDAMQMKLSASRRTIPVGLPLYQRFPGYIHLYLASLIKDYRLMRDFQFLPIDKWSATLRGKFHTMDVQSLSAVEALARGLMVMKSTIKHKSAKDGVFTNRDWATGEDIICYYGTLVYRDMSWEGNTMVYGEGMLSVTKQRFNDFAVETRGVAKDSGNNEHVVYIVPTPYSVASKINDPRYLVGDEEYHLRTTNKARRANCKLEERMPTGGTTDSNRSILTNHDLTDLNLVTIRATRPIKKGEELFVSYGSNFVFSNRGSS